jgi:hypothetical protein
MGYPNEIVMYVGPDWEEKFNKVLREHLEYVYRDNPKELARIRGTKLNKTIRNGKGN